MISDAFYVKGDFHFARHEEICVEVLSPFLTVPEE